MRIAIVHYHLKRGGVTRVVESTIRGLVHLEEGTQCAVLTGDVPEDFRYRDRSRVVEGLHYSNAQPETPDSATLVARLRAAAREILGADPDCWHIHNHSLGKNSAMPGVVAELAASGEALLLQLHDFAEDGRPENHRLNQERTASSACLYPDGRNIHYGFINARDYAIFQQAGLPPERLHLLANPVEASPRPTCDSEAKNILAALKAERLILYPVRAVRRKNFGEMLLWAALAEPGDVFATTLGPTNQNYNDAYQNWQRFARKNQLLVSLGIGERADWSFEAIMGAAHAILNTSIAEGFGLAFLEPWLFGKTIVGRDLPDITADFKMQGIDLGRLYPSLAVPADWIDRDELTAALLEGLQAAYLTYDRPLPKNALERALEAISPSPGKLDFGGLNEALQQQIIERVLADPAAKSELPRLRLSNGAATIRRNADKVIQAYSLPRYAENLNSIYHSIEPLSSKKIPYIDPGKILDGFLQPERFRLLRT